MYIGKGFGRPDVFSIAVDNLTIGGHFDCMINIIIDSPELQLA